MGRHSQTSSLNTTLVELGSLASRSLSRGTATGGHGRRRAEGPAKTPLSPMLFRAGGAAAVLSLAVSGGAYAAVLAQDEGGVSAGSLTALGSEARGEVQGGGSEAGAPAPVEGESTQFSTVTEDVTEAHGTVEKETDSLPAGETKVETEGVDGVTRTTYQVASVGGQEVSREAVSTVVVAQKVDEVVLKGTGAQQQATPEAPAEAPAAEAPAEAAPAPAPVAEAGTDAAGAQAIAKSMMAGYGWNDSEFSCLVSLWERESNWNYQAENPSSGAYGIPQSLPGNKMAAAGADWQTNPTTQITWGLGYISERYGSPCGAWAHSEAVGWY
ncbi:G5 domain-containing protein [Actinomyces bowdenii]|uniref:G5 domain-containing protein n=1 Tax=Actinomyces bowdenii TaxID=131109 RepID=A0A853EKR0_9ACTO|nr:G5 domain-containing protein [Actinomyces bowdenii]MBF0697744.1 G5 domain-containing protein [Actinomyces bowdenii]NYS69917.1 G5 domain-containing protein [Actinomyces bowdenii]